MTGLLIALVLTAAAVAIWWILRPSVNPWQQLLPSERARREQASQHLREAVSEEDRLQRKQHAQREGRL